MIALPWSLWLEVGKPGRRTIRLWLPLFLLWLMVLPLLLLAFAVTALVDVVLLLSGETYHHYTLLLYRCLGLLGETRGTTVRIDADETVVRVLIR